MADVVFAASGGLAGLAQVGLLFRASSGNARATSFALRLALVGAVLLAAAVSDALLPAAAGWSVGFVAGFLLLYLKGWR